MRAASQHDGATSDTTNVDYVIPLVSSVIHDGNSHQLDVSVALSHYELYNFRTLNLKGSGFQGMRFSGVWCTMSSSAVPPACDTEACSLRWSFLRRLLNSCRCPELKLSMRRSPHMAYWGLQKQKFYTLL